ncbi:hypothetical protein NTE03_003891 [Vibrio mimicus]
MNRFASIGLVLVGFYLFAVFYVAVYEKDGDIVTSLNSLGNFLSAGGAVAAILSVLQVSNQRLSDKAYNSALTMILECERLLHEAENQLFDGDRVKNNRIEWIVAADNLNRVECLTNFHINKLIDQYHLDELKIKLESLLERSQYKLFQHLSVREGNVNASLPLAFFYGVPDWETRTVDEAKEFTKENRTAAYWDNEDTVAPCHGITQLDKASVFVVGRFMLMFDNPEFATNLSEYENFPMGGQFEGMAKYIQHHT